jgi:hypothetical protein
MHGKNTSSIDGSCHASVARPTCFKSLLAVPSAEAVERFNQESEKGGKRVAALIHITC